MYCLYIFALLLMFCKHIYHTLLNSQSFVFLLVSAGLPFSWLAGWYWQAWRFFSLCFTFHQSFLLSSNLTDLSLLSPFFPLCSYLILILCCILVWWGRGLTQPESNHKWQWLFSVSPQPWLWCNKNSTTISPALSLTLSLSSLLLFFLLFQRYCLH